MEIAKIFMLSWCLVLIEGSNENLGLSDNMDADSERDVLRELKSMRERLENAEQTIDDQRQMIDDQGQMIDDQGQMIERNRIAISASTTKRAKQEKKSLTSEAKSRYTALGCVDDTITISCPDERLITITDANYGIHKFSCSKDCCPPNPYQDCTQAVSEVEDHDWPLLQFMCNNETSCEWKYTGRKIDGCDAFDLTEIADYMQIYYDCLPENTDEPVGFTAHSPHKVYRSGETMWFSMVQSNFGGYYNGQTCSFHCPHHGIYLFSVGYNADEESYLYVHIMRDNVLISSSMAYALTNLDTNSFSQASALVIVECDVGQVVWARSSTAYRQYAINEKSSQFSGYLLHRYD